MTWLGVHLTDLFISFARRLVSLRATTAENTDMSATEDLVSCELRFASGVKGMFACLSATPYYGRLNVFSERGWLEVWESGNIDRGLPSELAVCNKRREETRLVGLTVRNIDSRAATVHGEAPYRFSAVEILEMRGSSKASFGLRAMGQRRLRWKRCKMGEGRRR